MNSELTREMIDQLVQKYLPYAEAVGRSVRSQLAFKIEMDEVLSLARMGLLDAASKYDPTRNVSFKTYAYYRIRGAIYDGIRSQGPTTRTEVAKYKFQKGMELYLQQQNEARVPHYSQRYLEHLEEFKNIVSVMTSVYLLSLDSVQEISGEGISLGDTPHEEIEKSENIRTIKNAIANLSEQEQQIIRMYYYEEMTMEEIGKTLNLSRSWICRIHSQALRKLKRTFTRSGSPGKTSLRV